MAQRSALTVRRLAGAAWPLMVLAFLVNGAIVAVALQAVNVPGTNEMIDFPVLLFASVGPVLGNSVGFYAAYRAPMRASLVGFLAPGVIITAGFAALAVSDFADHDDTGVLVTALAVTIAPTVVAVAGLLRRRADLLGPVAAHPAPPLPAGLAPAGHPGPGPAGAPPGSAQGAPTTVERTADWTPAQLGRPAPPPAESTRGAAADAESRAKSTATWDLASLDGPPTGPPRDPRGPTGPGEPDDPSDPHRRGR